MAGLADAASARRRALALRRRARPPMFRRSRRRSAEILPLGDDALLLAAHSAPMLTPLMPLPTPTNWLPARSSISLL